MPKPKQAYEFYDYKQGGAAGTFVRRVAFEDPEDRAGSAAPPSGDREQLLADSSSRGVSRAVRRFMQGSFFLLGLVGVLVSIISFIIDYLVNLVYSVRQTMTDRLGYGPLYPAWIAFTLFFALLAVVITRSLSPHAAGSGIPQMKAILRGISLKEYLSMRTLIAKVLGITASLSSGLLIGKEGPFVHIASMVAQQLMKRVPIFSIFKNNQGRRLEILSAACAVGVACSFGSPIGGVLFSIEVTSSYFAVRNYWRGFFATVTGAFVFRLLSLIRSDASTITTLFSTDSETAIPYRMPEIIAFAILGIITGFAGAAFVALNKYIVQTVRDLSEPGRALAFLNRHWLVYPTVVSVVIMSLIFPGIGLYLTLSPHDEITALFSRRPLLCFPQWAGVDIFGALILSLALKYFLTALAISIPFPAGVFMPVFVLGALQGRIFGELMAVWFPSTTNLGLELTCDWVPDYVVPGGYAIVGAAAFTAAVTHTISTSVIVFELTGSISRILPVMIAVLIANGIAQKLSLSIYDSIIKLNGIPYVPSLRQLSRYEMTASRIMRTSFPTLLARSTYRSLVEALSESPQQTYPLLESEENRILLGSVQRIALLDAIERALGESPAPQIPNAPQGTAKRDRLGIRRVRSAMKTIITAVGDVTLNEKEEIEDLDAQYYLTAPGPDATQADRDRYARLDTVVDFTAIPVDPSPFQMADATSLHHLHTIFAMLGVQTVYITRRGVLVGVVGINELRHAVEATPAELLLQNQDTELAAVTTSSQRAAAHTDADPSDVVVDDGNVEIDEDEHENDDEAIEKAPPRRPAGE
eukprot:m.256438 g.256438  ORF g.256438 m.256438 type:complete len:811 (-) comp20163_c0_seq1:227-2659(-)